MKYIKPTYEKEKFESNDIILTSGGATIKEINESTASVSASILDVLGLKR